MPAYHWLCLSPANQVFLGSGMPVCRNKVMIGLYSAVDFPAIKGIISTSFPVISLRYKNSSRTWTGTELPGLLVAPSLCTDSLETGKSRARETYYAALWMLIHGPLNPYCFPQKWEEEKLAQGRRVWTAGVTLEAQLCSGSDVLDHYSTHHPSINTVSFLLKRKEATLRKLLSKQQYSLYENMAKIWNRCKMRSFTNITRIHI